MSINTSVSCSIYPLNVFANKVPQNTAGHHWLSITPMIMGLTDLRARSGTFTTPWNAVSPLRQPLPDLSIPELRNIKDLIDVRGQEIYQSAKALGKKIMVMWSGGIDSTAVLVSILKAVPVNEHKDLITVCMSADSLSENLSFYKNFISNKLPIVHRLTMSLDNELLNNYIILHGDPGDALFGPSIGRYKSLINDGRHLLSYNESRALLYQCINPNQLCSESTAKWFVDKICDNLEEVGLDQVTSIADWFWWQYINFKWEGSIWRPFHGVGIRHNHTNSITADNSKQYLSHVFFHTDYFQRWSYTNLKQLVTSCKDHKKEAREYIFDFDKNQSYYENKSKIASMPLYYNTIAEKDYWKMPVYHDSNWVGYTLENLGVYDETLSGLLSYNG